MNFSRIEIKNDLVELYGDSISLFRNDENWAFNVIFFNSNLDDLNKRWDKVSSAVSMCYQADVTDENEFEKWNLYIIYVCTEKVDKELNAKIENDKFSSRKIVEDNVKEEFSNELANNLIIKYITNTDIIEIIKNTSENVRKEYLPKNETIWKLINNDSILRNKELQKNIIQQLKNFNYEN